MEDSPRLDVYTACGRKAAFAAPVAFVPVGQNQSQRCRRVVHALPRYTRCARVRVDMCAGEQGEAALGPDNLIPTWSCVKHCGACCYLSADERDLHVALQTAEQVTEYLSLIGPDGWCVHFDKQKRSCSVYASRPLFCRVDRARFEELYGVADDAQFNEFAVGCCEDHIESIYGGGSAEMDRFAAAVYGDSSGNDTDQ
ncbi:hypothetical protein FVE85_5112 [Porphyridium purpureum]|uniref:YkgJ family cysteine cluster protein n=1 Tax=Porphyridium purpureum TaxID=35688 RepID=A0A5J4Z4L7_PORPP|nr:hypothetical protein FVE85_5112 [Porphyridium purpureum]|eukprot:POR6154..scf295_1